MVQLVIQERATVLRGLQILFAVIALATGAAVVDVYNFNYENFALATAVIAFVWYIVTLTPAFKFLPPVAVVIAESILTLFWLIAFALMATDWGSTSCNYYYFYNDSNKFSSRCQVAKANTAFDFLSFFVQAVVLGLLIAYSIVPSARSGLILQGNFFSIGAIFGAEGAHLTRDIVDDPEAIPPANDTEGKEDLGVSSDEPVATATETDEVSHAVVEPNSAPLSSEK